MMKSGAPPDKFGVLYHMVTYRVHGFTSRINSKGYHPSVPGLISIFLEMVWVPLILHSKSFPDFLLSRIYRTPEISENKKDAKISGFTVDCQGLHQLDVFSLHFTPH